MLNNLLNKKNLSIRKLEANQIELNVIIIATIDEWLIMANIHSCIINKAYDPIRYDNIEDI